MLAHGMSSQAEVRANAAQILSSGSASVGGKGQAWPRWCCRYVPASALQGLVVSSHCSPAGCGHFAGPALLQHVVPLAALADPRAIPAHQAGLGGIDGPTLLRRRLRLLLLLRSSWLLPARCRILCLLVVVLLLAVAAAGSLLPFCSRCGAALPAALSFRALYLRPVVRGRRRPERLQAVILHTWRCCARAAAAASAGSSASNAWARRTAAG